MVEEKGAKNQLEVRETNDEPYVLTIVTVKGRKSKRFRAILRYNCIR